MKKNPWPYAIIICFAIFITAMTSWIVFAVRNDHQLVRKDYYEHELKFQNELDSFQRAADTDVRVSYDHAAQVVTIALPAGAAEASAHFYRPSDVALDKQLRIAPQTPINVSAFAEGLWKLRLSWKVGEANYRHDETLVLAKR